jgi:phosphohistidine phosphatase SixA
MQKRCGRRALLALLTTSHLSRRLAPAAAEELPLRPVTVEEPAGESLVARLRAGGLVLFFRHADTRGEPCDRTYDLGDRAGQRNLSAEGRAQAARIGARLRELGIPVAVPVLAGPVFRARDTAEIAFGPARVVVTEALIADDYTRGEGALERALTGHRRLFGTPVPAGTNRVLVGHRTPAILVLGDERVGGRAFPEGAALVLAPGGGGDFALLGILVLAPIPGGGFHACQ